MVQKDIIKGDVIMLVAWEAYDKITKAYYKEKGISLKKNGIKRISYAGIRGRREPDIEVAEFSDEWFNKRIEEISQGNTVSD